MHTCRVRMVQLYTCEVTDHLFEHLSDDYNFEMALRHLDLKAQAAIRRIPAAGDSKMKLLSKLFNLFAVAHACGESEWSTVTISHLPCGKPYATVNGRMVNFNNSSSNRHLAVVVNDNETDVGVDLSHAIQNVNPNSVLNDFASIFDAGELDVIRRSADPYFTFNHFWTLKEAYTKFTGTGLTAELSDIIFSAEGLDQDLHRANMDNFTIKWLSGPSPQQWHSSVLVPQSEGRLPVIISIVGAKSIEWNHINFATHF